MATRMLQRRGTAAEWAAQNPVLSAGEIGFETDTKVIKAGDGVTAWNDLTGPYLARGGGTMTGALVLIAPTEDDHAARKVDVTSGDSALATAISDGDTALGNALTSHEESTNPHSSTALATPSRLMLRDANGRAKVADPEVDGDIANRKFVIDNAPKKLLDQVIRTDVYSVSADSFTAFHATDLTVNFTVPASGKVRVVVYTYFGLGSNSSFSWVTFLDGSTEVLDTTIYLGGGGNPNTRGPSYHISDVDGLTPDDVLSWKFAGFRMASNTITLMAGISAGPPINTDPNAGQTILEVWEA